MHKISDEFEFRPDRTTDYRVSCPWATKKFPIDLQWENAASMLARSFFIESSSMLLVTRTSIKAWSSSVLGRIRPLILELHVLAPWVMKISQFWIWISLKPVGQSGSDFMCSISGVGKRLHKVLGQIGSKLWFPWQQKAPSTIILNAFTSYEKWFAYAFNLHCFEKQSLITTLIT